MSRRGSRFSETGFRNSVFGFNAVLKKGEMEKEVSGIFGARWKKRYFVVNSHYLKYYNNAEASKDITDTKAKGTIDLAKCKDFGSKGEEVSVTIEGGGVQIMKASNAKDAEEWMGQRDESSRRRGWFEDEERRSQRIPGDSARNERRDA
jgi:hypothetical protein